MRRYSRTSNGCTQLILLLSSFIAGGIAGCGAVTVTHSFETVKIRLQLQGELQSKKDAPRLYRGVLHGASVILKNEGMRGLLRGLSCGVRLAPT